MRDMLAGLTSGIVMASLFIPTGTMMLFFAAKDPPPALKAVLSSGPVFAAVMAPVVVSFPVWGAIGVVLGWLHGVMSVSAPGAGLGSPTLSFTLSILVLGGMLAGPALVVMRRVWPGVLFTAALFMGVFGWLLPYFAA